MPEQICPGNLSRSKWISVTCGQYSADVIEFNHKVTLLVAGI
jgi:hypothetical protein